MTTKKKLAVAALAAVLTCGGYVAYAYFATTGGGTGTGAVGTSTAMTVNQTTPAASDYSSGDGNLYPGTTLTAHFTVSNPSPGHQFLTSIALASWNSNKAGCDSTSQPTWITMPTVVVNQDYPSGNGQAVTPTGTITFNNLTTVSQDACKSAAITFSYDTQPTITAVSGSPFNGSGISGPNSVGYSPDGRFLTAANFGGTLSVYSVNQSSGALSPVSGSPYSTGGSGIFDMAYSPTGAFLAAANKNTNTVAIFAVNSVTGALSAVSGSPFTTGGSGPFAPAFSPNGAFLAVTNSGNANVAVFAINQSTGVPSAAPGSPFGGTGSSVISATFSPNGSWLVTGSQAASSNVGVFAVNATTGALAAAVGSPFSAGGAVQAVVFSGGGNFVNALMQSNQIAVRSFNSSTGALTAVAGSPFASGTGASNMGGSPNGRLLAVANNSGNTVSVLSVNQATGALSQATGSPFAAGANPLDARFSSDGRWLAVANGNSSNISVYSVVG